MPEIVFANSDSIVSNGQGGVRLLVVNDPFASDHPIVRAHPELFSESPHLSDDTVESATANPGERRNVRRG